MTIQDILIQVIGFIPSVIAITSLQSNNRKRILVLQFICCIMWSVHYSFLGAYTAVLTNIISLIRSVICYNNEQEWAKKPVMPVLLIILYLGSSFITWDGFYSLLPFVSMALSTFALWTHNMKKTRLLFVLNSPPLLLYNILAGSYSCALIEFIAFLSFIIAVYRFDIRKVAIE